MDKRTRRNKPILTRDKRIHRQDCMCDKCIEIDSVGIPRIKGYGTHKKRDEIYNINIRLEKEELNQKPIYRDFFYQDIVEEMDDYLRILRRKDRQLEQLKDQIKNLEDWVRDYQQISDIKKDINKLKNDMKELQDFNKTIILREIKDQINQTKIDKINEEDEKIKQRKQTKKFKED